MTGNQSGMKEFLTGPQASPSQDTFASLGPGKGLPFTEVRAPAAWRAPVRPLSTGSPAHPEGLSRWELDGTGCVQWAGQHQAIA